MFACIRNISEDIAKLPIVMSRPRKGGGREAITEHPVLDLVNISPNPSMTAMSFWETVVSHPLGFHGGFAEIVQDGLGNPVQLWPLPPSSVEVDLAKDGSVQFIVRTDTTTSTLAANETFHIHGLGINGVMQWILHQVGATSFGKAIATQEFSAAFFGNGATPTGILEAPVGMKKEAIQNLIKSFRLRHSGQGNQHKTALLTDGVQYKPISTDPDKSQLIEALHFSVEEVARWYRMPPNKIQHLLRSTYSNIEQENKSYVIDTLQPWSVRVCQEIRRKLLPRNPEILVEHDFSMLLEADVAAKTEALFKEFQMGMHSINDLLIYAGRTPSDDPNCEERFVLANIQPLKISMANGAKNQNSATQAQANDESAAEDAADGANASKSHLDLLVWYVRKFLNEVEDKVERASKRAGGVGEWMQEFFPRHERHVAETLAIPIRSILSTAQDGQPLDASKALSERYAREYCANITKRIIDGHPIAANDTAKEIATMILEDLYV